VVGVAEVEVEVVERVAVDMAAAVEAGSDPLRLFVLPFTALCLAILFHKFFSS
jgi:hypothetical protein